MLKNSICFRVFLVILGGVLLLTGIALFAKVEKASDASGGSLEPIESTPPIVSDEPSQEEPTPPVSENPTETVVASLNHENYGSYDSYTPEFPPLVFTKMSDGYCYFGFELLGLKPNANYRLEWSIDVAIAKEVLGIYTAYSMPGTVDPCAFENGSLQWNGEYSFATGSSEEQYIRFYVAGCLANDVTDFVDSSYYKTIVQENASFVLFEIAQ